MLKKEKKYWQNTRRYVIPVTIIIVDELTDKFLLENNVILEKIKDENEEEGNIIVTDMQHIEGELEKINIL